MAIVANHTSKAECRLCKAYRGTSEVHILTLQYALALLILLVHLSVYAAKALPENETADGQTGGMGFPAQDLPSDVLASGYVRA